MQGTYKTMTELIYGGGLRLAECLSLRIKDIDFERQCLTIRSGKGNKDRQTLLSTTVIPALEEHLLSIRKYYESDLKNNKPICLKQKEIRALWIVGARSGLFLL